MTEFFNLAELLVIIAVAGFAASALGKLLVEEDGPFDILIKFRRVLGITEDIEDRIDDGEYQAKDELNVFGKMFTCTTCATTALSIVLGAICIFFPPAVKVVAVLAVVGLALKINE